MTLKMQEIEQIRGRPLKELLPELYKQHGNLNDVALELGVTQGTLSLWLMRLGLEIRSYLAVREDGRHVSA